MLSLENREQFATLLDAAVLGANPDADRPAIIYMESGAEDTIVSRRLFQKSARDYANGLRRLGVESGDLVVIAHTQNLASIYLFWGALLLGAIPSMFPTLTEKLDATIYMGNMAELARLSQVKAILTTDEFAAELSGSVPCPAYGPAILLGQEPAAAGKPGWTLPEDTKPDPAEIAFLQHSSGTTGLQKGVALSHQAVLNQLASYSQAVGLNGHDVIVSWLPLYHDMGLIAGFILPLFQGIPLVLMSPFDWVRSPAMLLRAIDRYQGTLCWQPNFAYNHNARRIRQRDSQGLTAVSMRLFINCSEPVVAESHQLFLERFVDNGLREEMLAVSYAMAENTFAVTQTALGETASLDIIDRRTLEETGLAQPVAGDHPRALKKVSCGPAIPGTAVRVVDGQGNPLQDRRVGEIAIQSSYMLSEYYRRPDLQPFHDGWYLTGDRGYMAGGEVYIIGRSKDLIINAGKNIYPQDIEAIINEIKGIHPGRAVAFGVADRREGTELIAVVAELDDISILDNPVRRKAIEKEVRRRVARQSSVSVSYVKLVDPGWLIKTSSGKIARGANRDKWLAERAD